MALDFIKKLLALITKLLLYIVLYICYGYVFAVALAVTGLSGHILVRIITGVGPYLSIWDFFCMLLEIWLLLVMLGLSAEILAFAGWFLLRMLRMGFADQNYVPLVLTVRHTAEAAVFWVAGEDVPTPTPRQEESFTA